MHISKCVHIYNKIYVHSDSLNVFYTTKKSKKIRDKNKIL